MSCKCLSRCVGVVSAVSLGTALERGGTMTAASGCAPPPRRIHRLGRTRRHRVKVTEPSASAGTLRANVSGTCTGTAVENVTLAALMMQRPMRVSVVPTSANDAGAAGREICPKHHERP
jgi:hypothetical protein